ncbi:MAG TPA: hypothetical protein VGN37_11165 [Actinocatenispora sp.]
MSADPAVDLSGVLDTLRDRYAAVLSAHRRAATGDPAALRGAGRTHRGQAERIDRAATDLADGTLADDWSGPAATAYRRRAGTLGVDLTGCATTLRRQSDVLSGAADALESAAAGIDDLRSGFDRQFAELSAAARAVPVEQVAAVLASARSVGDAYVAAAGTVTTALGRALTTLTLPEAT